MTTPFPGAGALALQAATPVAGFALQNATPNIISWTAPSDGALHRVMVPCSSHITTLETGGNVSVVFTEPVGGVGNSIVLVPGGQAANNDASNPVMVIVRAGTTVTVQQTSALTAGAATVWAEIWGN